MRQIICAITLAIVAMSASVTLADARSDVRVHADKDDKGYVIYKLTNSGDKNVKAKLRYKKSCSSTTTRQDPTEKNYWLRSKSSTQLRRAMANSDCRHTFRIINAEYY